MRSVTPGQRINTRGATRLSGAGDAPTGRVDGPTPMGALGRRVLALASTAVALHHAEVARRIAEGGRAEVRR